MNKLAVLGFTGQLDTCHGLLSCLCRNLRASKRASAPLPGHLQSLLWSPVSASGPCGEGLAGGHRRPPSDPRGSAGAGAECSHTSGICLGCRRAAGERGRQLEDHPSSSGHRSQEDLDGAKLGSWKDSARPVFCAMAHIADWRGTETSGLPAQ